MKEKAMKIVCDYINDHLDKSDPEPSYEVYIVWMCKILQNWKFLISSTLYYKKFENKVVKGE